MGPISVVLEEVLSLLALDGDHAAAARGRQAGVWRVEEPDYLPLLFAGPPPARRDAHPRFDLRACYFDPEKMLIEQAWGMAAVAASGSDALPSMRPNLGCGVLATTLGARQEVFPDRMPWVVERAGKAHLSRLEPGPHLLNRGEFPRVLDYARYFVERLAGRAPVYCFDTQGPFDTAHLAYGDAIFTDLYDDPPFVRHLMELCTSVFIEGLKALKAVTGEPLDAAYHYNEMYMERGGARSSEDTTTLIRPADIETFILPYLARCFQPFGGGYVHFCGHHAEILRMLCGMPEVRGVNFGNPEAYDPAEVLPMMLERGIVYYGQWPARDGETLESYFRRILEPLDGRRAGLILQLPGGLEPWRVSGQDAMRLWHTVQNALAVN